MRKGSSGQAPVWQQGYLLSYKLEDLRSIAWQTIGTALSKREC
jgi:hypothetical protein